MKQLRVLMVEDSENDALLVLRELRKAGYDLAHKRVDNAAALEEALNRQQWDVIISDFAMPGFSGLESLKLARRKGLDVPFILVSGQIGEDTAVEAMRAGANDYIMKDKLQRLAPAVKRELFDAQIRSEYKKAQAAHLAEHEDRLLAYQRLAHLGELSGSIAHELRNPLATIDTSTFYLQTKLGSGDEKIQTHLKRIRTAIDRCSAVIQNFLDEARMREPRLTRLDLRDFTSELIVDCHLPGGIEVIRDFPETGIMINGDPELLRMSFRNVIHNAAEAMNGNGKLRIAICAGDGKAEVSFKDSGPGISPENLPRIFEPLFTTKTTGVGLGLSVARMAVGKHGGTIQASSEPGSGATFIVRLPLLNGAGKI